MRAGNDRGGIVRGTEKQGTYKRGNIRRCAYSHNIAYLEHPGYDVADWNHEESAQDRHESHFRKLHKTGHHVLKLIETGICGQAW